MFICVQFDNINFIYMYSLSKHHYVISLSVSVYKDMVFAFIVTHSDTKKGLFSIYLSNIVLALLKGKSGEVLMHWFISKHNPRMFRRKEDSRHDST